MVKAIFFDVDGTLLRFNEETIPDSILDSLRCLKNSGIKVFVASGRSYAQIKRVTDFPFDGFVASNGAVGIDAEGKVLYKSSIPYIDLFNLVQYLESTSSTFCISYMTEEGVFANDINELLEHHYALIHIPLPKKRPLLELLRSKVFQLTAYISPEQEKTLIDNIMVNCVATRWHDDFADINNQRYNKATGVAFWLRYYGIAKRDTMAFGDGGNDIEMLKYVKYGVAMGNARQEVKDIAYHVTTEVDEAGVVQALKYFNLLQEEDGLITL